MNKVGVALFDDIKDRMLRIAKGEHKPTEDEPTRWYTPQAAAGRIEKLEMVLDELIGNFEEAISYIDNPGSPENEFMGPTLLVLAGRNRILAARAVLAPKPVQEMEE